jgi:lantibiotic modifying enzyme
MENADGVVWPADPAQPRSVTPSLYTGTTGVVLFLTELHHATGDAGVLAEARRGGDALIASLGAMGAEDGGLYTGAAGTAFVLSELWRATDDNKYRDAARTATTRLLTGAKAVGRGAEWNDSSDIISGGAGIVLFLLYAKDRLGIDGLEVAARAGHRLIDLGQPSHGGLKWAISPSFPSLYPNFSHGAAGVGYALAPLHQATGEKAFLDAALQAAHYLDQVADRTDGCKIFHHEPGGESLYYLSWCHGGAGTSRLFYRLGLITGEKAWDERIHCYARGITAMGAPEQRSPGYWNNISQCCGNAGVGEFFYALDRLHPGKGYGEIGRRAANDVLLRATETDTGLRWIQAEHRVQPENLVAQTGFMQGAAGTGTLFIHADAQARGRSPAIVMPDSPFV